MVCRLMRSRSSRMVWPRALAQGQVATVAATDMAFLRPVKVGDVVCCYTDLARRGRTSLTFRVEAWVLR
jgi:acyl-CoA thioesterase YciA